MTFEINFVVCVLAVLGSLQTSDQSSALPPDLTLAALPSHAGSSASPHRTDGPWNGVEQRTRNPAGRDETSAQTTTVSKFEGMVHPGTATNAVYKAHLLTTSSAVDTSQDRNVPFIMTAAPGAPPPSAAADGLSPTLTAQRTIPPAHLWTAGGAPLTRDPFTAFSSQPAHTVQDARSAVHTSTFRPESESLTTGTAAQSTTAGHPLSPATGRGPAGATLQEVPPELNIGDEEIKGPRKRSSSPLDPLLAGLLSVFIVTTAIVFVILFLKFRQRTNHPEFHRLQDLPMDDLMEDTPLSRYTY